MQQIKLRTNSLFFFWRANRREIALCVQNLGAFFHILHKLHKISATCARSFSTSKPANLKNLVKNFLLFVSSFSVFWRVDVLKGLFIQSCAKCTRSQWEQIFALLAPRLFPESVSFDGFKTRGPLLLNWGLENLTHGSFVLWSQVHTRWADFYHHLMSKMKGLSKWPIIRSCSRSS